MVSHLKKRIDRNMAGSIRWFTYTDDYGDQWAIKRDESLTELVNGDVGGTIADFPTLPAAIQPRYARYINPSGLGSRTVTILDPNLIGSLVPNFEDVQAAPPRPFHLSFIGGENRTVVLSTDTRLIDGDTDTFASGG
jgi:hypothetical protein